MNDPSRNEPQEDGLSGLVRRVLAHGPTPEERLEEMLAERRRELDETAARFDESIADLERREELLRDSRASVERMLRLGRSDLEARENELTDFLRGLTDREARIEQAEAELARRRQELGAVELKRASIERRERELDAREAELAEREARADEAAESSARADDRPAPGESALRPAELEPPPIGMEPPPAELEPPPAELEPPPIRMVPPSVEVEPPPIELGPPPIGMEPPPPLPTEPITQARAFVAQLAFVPGVEYRLLELELPEAEKGSTVVVEGVEYVLARLGPSPLPGDSRRCAYLVRGGPSRTSRGSS